MDLDNLINGTDHLRFSSDKKVKESYKKEQKKVNDGPLMNKIPIYNYKLYQS